MLRATDSSLLPCSRTEPLAPPVLCLFAYFVPRLSPVLVRVSVNWVVCRSPLGLLLMATVLSALLAAAATAGAAAAATVCSRHAGVPRVAAAVRPTDVGATVSETRRQTDDETRGDDDKPLAIGPARD